MTHHNHPLAHRALNILVVEDYEVLRNAMVKTLTKAGHRILGVGMAEEVDDLPMGCLPDMYVIDLNLPGEDGLSLVRRIRSSAPTTKIVLVTARTATVDRAAGYAAGADIYLPKPVDPDELVAIAQSLSERWSVSAPEVGQRLILVSGKLTLYGPQGQAMVTPTETSILGALARAPSCFLEHWQLVQHLGASEDISKDSQEVRMGRLRKKLIACGAVAPALKAIRGQGYKLLCDIELH